MQSHQTPWTRINAVHQIAERGLIDNIRVDAIAATADFAKDVDQRGLDDLFHIRAVLDEQEKLEWFRSLNIFVLPSLTERFPDVLLEAMSCGIAVVASSVAVIAGVTTCGDTVILIELTSPGALVVALRRLRENPVEPRLMGTRARATTVERYAMNGCWTKSLSNPYTRRVWQVGSKPTPPHERLTVI